ncbi:hypothetical protein ACCP91_13665 [Xanthomonas axonopodis pv. cyamopsidis]|uniref:hypothetical protein n=1 Tax=Xanthomonas axonopodis TaxID=53413 RepID=UPI0035567B4F
MALVLDAQRPGPMAHACIDRTPAAHPIVSMDACQMAHWRVLPRPVSAASEVTPLLLACRDQQHNKPKPFLTPANAQCRDRDVVATPRWPKKPPRQHRLRVDA